MCVAHEVFVMYYVTITGTAHCLIARNDYIQNTYYMNRLTAYFYFQFVCYHWWNKNYLHGNILFGLVLFIMFLFLLHIFSALV